MTLTLDTRHRLQVALALDSAGTEVADVLDGDVALASGQIVVGSAGGVATDVALSGDATLAASGALTLAAQVVNGTNVKNVATANVIGGIPVVHVFTLAAGALADTDIVLTHKTRIVDAYLVLQGAGVASTTLQVKSTANAITNAMAASGSDQALIRATTLDDANWEIAAGGTLRVTSASGATQPAATVFVHGYRVA